MPGVDRPVGPWARLRGSGSARRRSRSNRRVCGAPSPLRGSGSEKQEKPRCGRQPAAGLQRQGWTSTVVWLCPDGPTAWMTVTRTTLVPCVSYDLEICGPVVVALVPSPKSH